MNSPSESMRLIGASIDELRTKVEALETMREAVLDLYQQHDKLKEWVGKNYMRIKALEASATCPHIISSDEGTSYCGLAEQTARIGQSDVPANTSAFELSDDDPIPQRPAPIGSLVERVAIACAKPCNETWEDQARAVLREVAEWLRENEISFLAACCIDREVKQ